MSQYINLFLIGLTLSFGPCLFFCSPIILPYIAATKKGWIDGLKSVFIFSVGRILAYLVLGILATFLGSAIHEILAGKTEIILRSGGLIISSIGLIIVSGIGAKSSLCPGWCKELAGKGFLGTILLGLVVGFLPCMPLLGVLTYIAVTSRNLLDGLLYALFFGLGVLISPLFLLGPLASALSQLIAKNRILNWVFPRLCGIIMVIIGIYFTV